MDDLKYKAAIFLEEMGVSGDAQIGIDDEHAPEEEMKGGAYYLHELLAAFVDEVEARDVPLMRIVSGKAADVADKVKSCAVDAHMGTEDPDKAKAEAIEIVKEYGKEIAKQQRELCSKELRTRHTIMINMDKVKNAPEPPL